MQIYLYYNQDKNSQIYLHVGTVYHVEKRTRKAASRGIGKDWSG